MAMRLTAVILLTVSLLSFAALQASNPRSNYLLYCSGCHLVNGAGNHPNVPTLHDELGRMPSVPATRAYLVQYRAAQAPIDDAALADVINWVLRQWNSKTPL